MAGLPETAGHHCWVEWGTIMELAEVDVQDHLRKEAARKERARNLGRARR